MNLVMMIVILCVMVVVVSGTPRLQRDTRERVIRERQRQHVGSGGFSVPQNVPTAFIHPDRELNQPSFLSRSEQTVRSTANALNAPHVPQLRSQQPYQAQIQGLYRSQPPPPPPQQQAYQQQQPPAPPVDNFKAAFSQASKLPPPPSFVDVGDDIDIPPPPQQTQPLRPLPGQQVTPKFIQENSRVSPSPAYGQKPSYYYHRNMPRQVYRGGPVYQAPAVQQPVAPAFIESSVPHYYRARGNNVPVHPLHNDAYTYNRLAVPSDALSAREPQLIETGENFKAYVDNVNPATVLRRVPAKDATYDHYYNAEQFGDKFEPAVAPPPRMPKLPAPPVGIF